MDKHIITKVQSDNLYRSLKFLHDTFCKHNIKYFTAFGTLLGAVRNQGIIPWDDDGDICVFLEDVDKIRKLKSVFEKNGFDLIEKTEGNDKPLPCTRKKNSCTWIIINNNIKDEDSLGVDLFVVDESKEKITYCDPYWGDNVKGGGKNCYFNKNLVFPLVPVLFGNFFMYSPANAIENLNRCYGNDWSSMGQRLYDHINQKWVNSKKRPLTPIEFLTFKAPKDTENYNPPKIIHNELRKDIMTELAKQPRKLSPKKTKKKSLRKKK